MAQSSNNPITFIPYDCYSIFPTVTETKPNLIIREEGYKKVRHLFLLPVSAATQNKWSISGKIH